LKHPRGAIRGAFCLLAMTGCRPKRTSNRSYDWLHPNRTFWQMGRPYFTG
jgi:hypothetical protein